MKLLTVSDHSDFLHGEYVHRISQQTIIKQVRLEKNILSNSDQSWSIYGIRVEMGMQISSDLVWPVAQGDRSIY